jgi:hypothetical protein
MALIPRGDTSALKEVVMLKRELDGGESAARPTFGRRSFADDLRGDTFRNPLQSQIRRQQRDQPC